MIRIKVLLKRFENYVDKTKIFFRYPRLYIATVFLRIIFADHNGGCSSVG